jgi:hypothetical protein
MFIEEGEPRKKYMDKKIEKKVACPVDKKVVVAFASKARRN